MPRKPALPDPGALDTTYWDGLHAAFAAGLQHGEDDALYVRDFGHAIDLFIEEAWATGQVRSKNTEKLYRQALYLHADDLGNRHPAVATRVHVAGTLKRWRNPNTIKARLAAMVSFYDWAMQVGLRRDNPARQVRRPRKIPVNIYRLTRGEAAAMLGVAHGSFERRVITIGLATGLRNSELRGLTGRHFARTGAVWVSPDIGKGQRERWVPVLPDLEAVAAEIRATVAEHEFVLPRQVPIGGAAQVEHAIRTGGEMRFKDDPSRPCSQQHLGRLVKRVAERAGIRGPVTPHSMRRAFADHINRSSSLGAQHAQALLGHSDIQTTISYTSGFTLDELAAATAGLSYFDTPPDPGGRALRRVA